MLQQTTHSAPGIVRRRGRTATKDIASLDANALDAAHKALQLDHMQQLGAAVVLVLFLLCVHLPPPALDFHCAAPACAW